MLPTLVCLLAAAVLFVSLSRRFGFGSILGYLVAGVLIGPQGLGLVRSVGAIAQISELGVIMLLFLIGLELRIQRVWVMRRAVFGLGFAQVALAGAALAGLARLAGLPWTGAAVIGAGLALSSTAIVLPMLAERELLNGGSGRDAFSVLLFQDIASVPLIALVPLLAGRSEAASVHWPDVLKGAAVVAAILLGGRFLVRPLFRVIGGMRTQEVFTATALLVVSASAALAAWAKLPMSLGAFAAGVVLSESEYRHELQADVEPFEGLLLGFFFISVGMSANLSLALADPGGIALAVAALLAVKIAVAFGLHRLRGGSLQGSIRFALALPQGSEFGFVLFGAALASGVLARADAERANLIIAASMLASPVLFALSERWLTPLLDRQGRRPDDEVSDAAAAPVVILGFGRFGQVIGRILNLQRIRFNALDPDAENVDAVRRYGHKAYYGDATRLDLLRAVGVGQARAAVVALSDVEANLKTVEAIRRHFPGVKVLARARNRRHAHLLMDRGVQTIVRETYFSSLRMTELLLLELGLKTEEARRTVQAFRQHDEQVLLDQHGIYRDEEKLIQTAAEAADELRRLFEADRAGDPA
jgi:CPA2 family monovalent cation:H+ antiporter-2/glutathione-regulated potassium-efflux system protein KefB